MYMRVRVCVRACVRVYVRVCVCVCVRERDSKGEDKESTRKTLCVHVHV